MTCSSPKSSSSPGPSKIQITLADAEFQRDLRYAGGVHVEVAEHFVRVAADRMATRAIARPKEEQAPRFSHVDIAFIWPRANLSR